MQKIATTDNTDYKTATGKREPKPAGERLYPGRITALTLLGTLLVTLLASLDQTVVETAMPHIIADLHGFEFITWVSTIYLLTSTITIPIYGRLSDIIGRKTIFLFCIVLFLLTSALAGFSQSMFQLILFRALQGIAAGGLQPLSATIIADLFPPRERGRWQGLWGGVYALSAIIGPLLGGVLTDTLSWRWTFFVNLPVGLIALFVLIAFMPPLNTRAKKASIDYIGSGLFVFGSLFLLLSFSLAGNEFGWHSPQIIGLLAAAIALFIVLMLYCVRLQKKGKDPIIEPELFIKSPRIFDISLIATTGIYIALVGGTSFVIIFVQTILGTSVTQSALITMPTMLVAIAGSTLAGFLVSKTGKYKVLALLGIALDLFGIWLLTQLTLHSTYLDVVLAMAVLGLGIGSGMSIYTVAIQNAFPAEKVGQATSIMVYCRQLGECIGLAAMGSLVTASYGTTFMQTLPPQVVHALPSSFIAPFQNPLILLTSDHTLSQLQTMFTHLGPQGPVYFHILLTTLKAGLMLSIHKTFVLAFIMMIPIFVIVCFLKEIPLRDYRLTDQASTSETA